MNKEIEKELFKFELRDIQKEGMKHWSENLIVSAPTGSGKTWIAEFAAIKTIEKGGKVLYIAPLKALVNEKFHDFKRFKGIKVGKTSSDLDKSDNYLGKYDIIIGTSEKIDSLIRHKVKWLDDIKLVIADEIHLLNDKKRGPILEIILTHLRDRQIIGLSATISNAEEIAEWLNARLIKTDFRPVKLRYGVLTNNVIYFEDD